MDENDEQQKSLVADGGIYVPVGPLIAALGGTVSYNEAENLLTIVLEGVGNSTHGENETDESDPAVVFFGLWRADALNSLNILEDGTAQFMLNGTRYTCTWYLEGDTLQLLQNGKGGVSAVRSGDVLDVNIGGRHFYFQR